MTNPIHFESTRLPEIVEILQVLSDKLFPDENRFSYSITNTTLHIVVQSNLVNYELDYTFDLVTYIAYNPEAETHIQYTSLHHYLFRFVTEMIESTID